MSKRDMVAAASNEEDEDEWEYELSDEEPAAKAVGTAGALKGMFTQPIAFILVAVPVAWILHYVGEATGGEEGPVKPLHNFIANFFSIIPLAWVISESTEHLEKIVGPMLGTLLNSTFGNVVEIILSITMIAKGDVKIVQSSLLGAILMNTLGVLGLCFFVAGVNFHRKKFNQFQATYNLGMLAVATLGMSVPTGLAIFDDWSSPNERLALSRWVAICLFCMYIQWLVFSLCSHTALFDPTAKKKGEVHWFWAQAGKSKAGPPSGYQAPVGDDKPEESDKPDDDDEDEPVIAWQCACFMLAAATLIVTFHCDWLVESINPVCKQFGVKKAFIATVLLPMVGNFSEVIAAVSIACKGKLDLAMGVAIGSATQIALCVIPVAVFIAWACDQPLDLDFEFFQVKLLVISLLVVALLLMDGEANWLKGSLLVTAYVIVASSFWFIHDREFASAGEPPELIALNETSLVKSLVKTGVKMED